MIRLIWTPAATQDLVCLHAFLKQKNPDAAKKAIAAIRAGVRFLEGHPAIGRRVEGMQEQFREWFIDFGGSGYVALYRTEHELTTLLAIRHQKEAGY
ncbi:type II toxin-antitoxin system RelE/ParE family toxin [Orrella daihaiensis]|uniref:Type II toxin-antitoxin system RelE/ParE family toxin n=1 Tax=Orrella daihaiensis TaxID=2782176 RepID=A0ABY4AMS9_9BURK|nr:type II toxin-antitoxin system RelE/ParE family toxin [Orrella daihaiensis]UOD50690.1 type II toxin-antitoxin system RelE/ParE family toxin [Orrella daihaiensis]